MNMIWSTKNKPLRDCSLWYRGCYAIGWAIEGCPGKGILDNPHIFWYYIWLKIDDLGLALFKPSYQDLWNFRHRQVETLERLKAAGLCCAGQE
jgi:hypothetical protein